jgi:aspartate dehydrogenase
LKTVGIIGCGTIGSIITEAIAKGLVECDRLILFDGQVVRARKLGETAKSKATVVESVDEMVALKPSVVVEAASQAAAKQYAKIIVDSGVELIVMSVGALLELDLHSPRLHVPSGAIGGLDAISSATLAGINEVALITRKNPKALEMSNKCEEIVFEGSAREAVKRFPKEINVAATLALTAGADKVKVKLISDPRVRRNVHKVKVLWALGEMSLTFENDAYPNNLKTSALAAWSAIRLLKDILERTE